MNFKYLFILLLFFSKNLYPQNTGDAIFDTSYVHEIRITFADTSFWQTMTDHYFNNQVNGVATDVPYLEGSVSIDGNVMDSVGVRQKGFSSHFASNFYKKSLKLDFNEFISGQKYDGMKKLNLANGVGDPAMQRDFLAYNIMREAGIRVPRTSYAKVFLNDTYWGLYLIVEQVDKTFIKNNFVNDDGDLYKNIGFSSLSWLGTNPTMYDESIVLRTNKTTSDFSDFIEFVDVLNNTPNNDFADSIVNVFNVDYYLRVLAIDIMTNNWDSYIEHGRNFYLYHEPVSDLFYWIPWDYNLAFGGDFFAGGGGGNNLPSDPGDCITIQNGSSPYPGTDTIFIATINQDPYCCNNEWDGFCQTIYDDLSANGLILPPNLANCESIINGSCPYPSDDPIYSQVVNLDPTCCNENWHGDCQDTYDDIVSSINPQYLDFPLILNNPEKVLINKIMDVPAFREKYLDYCCQILAHNYTFDRLEPIIDFNGALIADAVEDDINFAFSFDQFNYDISDGDSLSNIPSLKEFFNHRIPTLEQNLIDLNHICINSTSAISWHDVVINEFVASNDSLSGIADANNDYDDWIEIYNNTDTEVDLTDFYLTDNFNSRKQWAFPAGTNIGIDEYLIVWADKDVTQEGLHTNFKLSSFGEQLMLVHFDGTVIDSLTFGVQNTNIPSARIPNGTGDFSSNVSPTFGEFNIGETSVLEFSKLDFRIFPNPANEFIIIEFDHYLKKDNIEIIVSNLLGQMVYKQGNINDWKTIIDVAKWNAGIFLIEVRGDNFKKVKKVIVE